MINLINRRTQTRMEHAHSASVHTDSPCYWYCPPSGAVLDVWGPVSCTADGMEYRLGDMESGHPVWNTTTMVWNIEPTDLGEIQ